MVRRAATLGLVLLPAALAVLLGFQAGGYFVGPTAVAALVLAGAAVLRLALSRAPLAGVAVPGAVVVGALALLCGWVVLSGAWSGAPGRALVEAGRTLLYLLVVAVLACVPRRGGELALLVRALAVGLAAVALAGLASRVLPELVSAPEGIAPSRLSWPVTYWNGLGILSGLALLLALHLTCTEREHPAVRVVAAAALPLLAATLLLTFSRGAIVATAAGAVVLLVLGRPRGALGGLLAAVPATWLALAATYDAELLGTDDWTSPAGAAQGRDLAMRLGVLVVLAAVVRLAALPLDARLARVRVGTAVRRTALAVAAVAAAGAFLVLDGPAQVQAQTEAFVEGASGAERTARDRLTTVTNNGRLEHWEVAWDTARSAPLRGAGAGTFDLAWERDRPRAFDAVDAHSLYAEVLAELGVVGLVLLLVALGTTAGVLLLGLRGPERALHAAVLAVLAAWAVHAGVDWDWEIPAVTLPVLALGGLALARRTPPPGAGRLGLPWRTGFGAACAGLAVLPATLALSQRELDHAVRALRAGDCPAATRSALEARRLLDARAEPYAVLAACELGRPRGGLAEPLFGQALLRDPQEWQWRYGLAVARAVGGGDPRPAAALARRANPRSAMTRAAQQAFARGGRAAWRREARRLPLALR